MTKQIINIAATKGFHQEKKTVKNKVSQEIAPGKISKNL